MKRNVQFGCGLSCPSDWVNYDASPTLRIQRFPVVGRLLTRGRVRFPKGVKFGDICGGLPEENGSVDNLYCSHVLEHLSLDDFRKALRESHRVLKPGGVFRLVMPDLEVMIDRYTASSSAEASIDFVRSTLMGMERRPRSLVGRFTSAFGNDKHLWLWDHQSTILELERAGFHRVRKCQFNDSERVEFKSVEDPDRFLMAVCLEAWK